MRNPLRITSIVSIFAIALVISCPFIRAASLEPGGTEPLAFGSAGEGSRTYANTARADFPKSSFQAEITVSLKSGHGGNGCAYLGMGKGEPNPVNFNEPTVSPAMVFRFAPSDFAGGQVQCTINGQPTGDEAALGDGTHRLRFTWDAHSRRAWLDIHRNWKQGDAFSPTISLFISDVTIDFGNQGHLFAGGAGEATFRDFTLQPVSDATLKSRSVSDTFPNDPSSGTWLPISKAAASIDITAAAPMDAFLQELHAHLRPVVCWYHGSHLQATRTLPGGVLQLPNSKWSVSVDAKPAPGEADARDVTLSFGLASGGAHAAGVAAAFDFDGWSTANYVLVPASIYNGNRNKIEHRGYCSGFDDADLYNKDLPQVTTELPQLSPEPGMPSKIEVSACDTTTPAICVFSPQLKRGFIVLSEQGIPKKGDSNGTVLDNAFCIEENSDRSHATLVVSSPGVRERKPEFIGFSGSPDRGIDWKAGDNLALRLRIFSFPARNIPELLEKFMTVRKDVTGPNHPRNLFPFSQAEKILTGDTDARWHDGGPGFRYYCCENSSAVCLGWVGGLINTFPMLALGEEMHCTRVLNSFAFAIPAAQGKSGHYLGSIAGDGKPSGRAWRPGLVLTRQDADVLFWTLKHFLLLKAQGRGADIRPEWEQSIRNQAQAFVNTWKMRGQWGNYINYDTGDIAIYNSTSGAIAIGGLALASAYYHDPVFLKTAKEAGLYYYLHDFAAKGFTYGACANIMQNADSETSGAFMTGLMGVYDVTGDRQWLEMSRNAANLLATWTVSYDYRLPTNTELGGLGAKLAGAIWASTQNKHGAPGICTSSCDPLFKIYRATGDTRYADLMRDIVHAHAEGIQGGGGVTERLTYCDADSRGYRPGGSNGWCETNGALMALEIPGIYLRTDVDRSYVFDAVEAQVLKRDFTGVTLLITNPTKYDASVAVLAENATEAAHPLGYTSFLNWPHAKIAAGKSGTFRIGSGGKAIVPE